MISWSEPGYSQSQWGVVRRVHHDVVADQVQCLRQHPLVRLGAEEDVAALMDVRAGRALDQRSVHLTTVLVLLVEPVHPPRHPCRTRLQEREPHRGELVEHAFEHHAREVAEYPEWVSDGVRLDELGEDLRARRVAGA